MPTPESVRPEGQSLPLTSTKQGLVWVLESEKIPKISTNDLPPRVPKEQKTKEIVEVFPVKKYARIKDHSLILTDVDGSQVTIELQNCTIVAVSASNLSLRKWAKRYPIRLESKTSLIYNRSKTCYFYLETSWEKESWCKELRLASCLDKKRLIWYNQLIEEFPAYLASLNSEYPSFLKSSALLDEDTDRSNRIDGPSSKVRLFLKKIAKKTSKTTTESKTSSIASFTHGERKIGENLRSQDVSQINGFLKSSFENNSSSGSLQDLAESSPPTSNHLANKSQHPVFPDAVSNEKFVNDEGTLCWNLLFSRLFFDIKRKTEINDAIKARIQKTLSNMRTPSYIGGVICTGLDLGNLPPYIHKMRVLPMGLNEVWAVEVDIEYLGGILLDFETRIGVCEPELQEDIMKTSSEPSSAGELTSDLLEGIEHYGNQLKSSSTPINKMENRDEGNKEEILKQSKSSRWASTYVSRWKSIKQSFADQVSQVPLSLAVRVASLRGTLRLHIKPPPSDQLWFGFTSMPEIDWNLESSIGDRKITNASVASLIGNRFKAAIREALVLPNCESVCIPFMIAETDDWVPRATAPFIWVNQESMDMAELDRSNSHHKESKSNLECSPTTHLDDKEEIVKNVVHVQEQSSELLPEFPTSQGGRLTSVLSNQSSRSSKSEELMIPLLRTDSGVESPRSSATSGSMIMSEEQSAVHSEEDMKPNKLGRRARMMSLGKKMGEKLEEKRRHIEEKSRLIVEKMRENSKD